MPVYRTSVYLHIYNAHFETTSTNLPSTDRNHTRIMSEHLFTYFAELCVMSNLSIFFLIS